MSLSQGAAPTAPDAPSGPGLVRWLTEDAGVRDHVLTDGFHTLTYAETAPFLARLDERFAAAGLSSLSGNRGRHPVAVECSQSVAGALVLLHLLSRAYDVVLLPELGSAKEAGTPRFIPSFCSHVLTAVTALSESGSPEDGIWDGSWDGIRLAANPDFIEEPIVTAFEHPEGPDLYLRTSGSTGIPKLTRMSHQRWLNNGQACVERWKLTAADRLSVPVPIFHSYGFGAAFVPGLLAGAAMDFGSGGNLLRYLDRESHFNPNVAFLTPALCDMFLTVRKSPRPYRLVVTAGDKIKKETMAGFEPRFGPLLNLYGSAEMGAVSAASPEDPADGRLGTAGYPLAGIELAVEEGPVEVDLASGDKAGLLQCRQRNGSVGYLMLDPGWRFQPRGDDEWFPTGDLARIRADGYVEVLGRSGLSVKRDGLLVVFADVESAVEKVDGIQRAVVVAAGETRRGPRLVAVCLARAESPSLDPEAVRRACFDHLPRYAVPDEIRIVDALPHLPSGKVDRRAVRELAGS